MVAVKGEILNPLGNNGLNVRKPITNALTLLLSRDKDAKLNDRHHGNKAAKIALALMKKAEEGDIVAIKEVIDRVEGKAVQQLDIKKADPFEGLSTDDIRTLATLIANGQASIAYQAAAGIGSPQVGALPSLHETEGVS